MRSRFFFLLACTTPLLALAASTQLSPNQPVVNFRLPDFTPEGNRSWLVRGSEARYINQGQVDIKELNLTLFNGQPDGKVETLLLSPSAEVRITDLVARGEESIRIINDRFEATGAGWTYAHKDKKISIARNVHVVLHTELKDILK